jgi:NIPSNAP
MHHSDGYQHREPWSVFELRQYTLRPGQRDVFVELFDREFIETQEAVGMSVVGQFRDLDHADRFVWVRGFRDMTSRAQALADFYGGPVWKVHGAKANATMIDSDDVLLLRPTSADSGFPARSHVRPPSGVDSTPPVSIVGASVYLLRAPVDQAFVEFFSDRVQPVLLQAGAQPLSVMETEPAENTYPTLPVRNGEYAFVFFSSFASLADHRAYTNRLDRSQAWRETVMPDLLTHLTHPPQHLRLAPTARSLLR